MKTIEEVIDLCISHVRFRKDGVLEVDELCPGMFTKVDLIAVREYITKDVLKSLGGKLSNDKVKKLKRKISRGRLENLAGCLTIDELRIYGLKCLYMMANTFQMTKDDANQLFGDDPIILAIYKVLERSKWLRKKLRAYEKYREEALKKFREEEAFDNEESRDKAFVEALKRFLRSLNGGESYQSEDDYDDEFDDESDDESDDNSDDESNEESDDKEKHLYGYINRGRHLTKNTATKCLDEHIEGTIQTIGYSGSHRKVHRRGREEALDEIIIDFDEINEKDQAFVSSRFDLEEEIREMKGELLKEVRKYVGRLEGEMIASFEEKMAARFEGIMKRIHQNTITLPLSSFKSAMTIK
jgi:hypothetical protein